MRSAAEFSFTEEFACNWATSNTFGPEPVEIICASGERNAGNKATLVALQLIVPVPKGVAQSRLAAPGTASIELTPARSR